MRVWGVGVGAQGEAVIARRLTPIVARWLTLGDEAADSLARATVLGSLTMVSVVFGEMVPKTVALRYPTETALATTLPMLWSGRVYAWFIAVLDRSSNLLRWLLRVPPATHRHVHSPDEIGLLIAQSRAAGLPYPQALVGDAAGAGAGRIALGAGLGERPGGVPEECRAPRLLPLRLSDGRVRLPGGLPLERARVWVEGAWPTDDVTVGAFIVRAIGRM